MGKSPLTNLFKVTSGLGCGVHASFTLQCLCPAAMGVSELVKCHHFVDTFLAYVCVNMGLSELKSLKVGIEGIENIFPNASIFQEKE